MMLQTNRIPMTQPNSPQARRFIELRKHPRFPTPSGTLFSFKSVAAPAHIDDLREGEGTLLELSLGGCKLTSDVPLTVGERYHLILQPSGGKQPISVEAAVVRWNHDKTYGLKFTSLQSEDESRLTDLLRDIRRQSS